MNFPLSPAWRERAATWSVRQWREWRLYLFFLCFVWVPLRSAVIDYSPVPTGSMNPTILEGDVVWVDKRAYGLRIPFTHAYVARWAEPARGEIVVVSSPVDGTRLVKRVVGVPGDVLELAANRLVLNGHPVDYTAARADYGRTIARRLQPYAFFAEEHLGSATHAVMGLAVRSGVARDFGPVQIPAGHYLLMGDSRDNSRDSREFGFVETSAILGRARGVLVSLDINDTWRPRFERTLTPLE